MRVRTRGVKKVSIEGEEGGRLKIELEGAEVVEIKGVRIAES